MVNLYVFNAKAYHLSAPATCPFEHTPYKAKFRCPYLPFNRLRIAEMTSSGSGSLRSHSVCGALFTFPTDKPSKGLTTSPCKSNSVIANFVMAETMSNSLRTDEGDSSLPFFPFAGACNIWSLNLRPCSLLSSNSGNLSSEPRAASSLLQTRSKRFFWLRPSAPFMRSLRYISFASSIVTGGAPDRGAATALTKTGSAPIRWRSSARTSRLSSSESPPLMAESIASASFRASFQCSLADTCPTSPRVLATILL